MQLSILFIPFDAAVQHNRRMATRGTTAHTLEKGVDGSLVQMSGDNQREIPGITLNFEADRPMTSLGPALSSFSADFQKKLLTSLSRPQQPPPPPPPISGLSPKKKKTSTSNVKIISKIVGHTCDQIIANAAKRDDPSIAAKTHKKAYPDIIFLSEEPGQLPFPQRFTAGDSGIEYRYEGHTGQRAVQRIFAYVKSSDYRLWSHSSSTKCTAPFNAPENILTLKCGDYCSFAGVHLSAKNVGATREERKQILEELEKFCREQKPEIQFLIGDFNIDVHAGTSGGGVGALPQSTIYMAQEDKTKATNAVRYDEGPSNSTNSDHFMGFLPIDERVRVHTALSLDRSLPGDTSLLRHFYSDHSPIYVELDFR